MANKEVAKLIRQIETWPGWRVEQRRGHWTVYPPDKAFPPIVIASTPSDHKWLANSIARLRRAGAPI